MGVRLGALHRCVFGSLSRQLFEYMYTTVLQPSFISFPIGMIQAVTNQQVGPECHHGVGYWIRITRTSDRYDDVQSTYIRGSTRALLIYHRPDLGLHHNGASIAIHLRFQAWPLHEDSSPAHVHVPGRRNHHRRHGTARRSSLDVYQHPYVPPTNFFSFLRFNGYFFFSRHVFDAPEGRLFMPEHESVLHCQCHLGCDWTEAPVFSRTDVLWFSHFLFVGVLRAQRIYAQLWSSSSSSAPLHLLSRGVFQRSTQTPSSSTSSTFDKNSYCEIMLIFVFKCSCHL